MDHSAAFVVYFIWLLALKTIPVLYIKIKLDEWHISKILNMPALFFKV